MSAHPWATHRPGWSKGPEPPAQRSAAACLHAAAVGSSVRSNAEGRIALHCCQTLPHSSTASPALAATGQGTPSKSGASPSQEPESSTHAPGLWLQKGPGLVRAEKRVRKSDSDTFRSAAGYQQGRLSALAPQKRCSGPSRAVCAGKSKQAIVSSNKSSRAEHEQGTASGLTDGSHDLAVCRQGGAVRATSVMLLSSGPTIGSSAMGWWPGVALMLCCREPLCWAYLPHPGRHAQRTNPPPTLAENQSQQQSSSTPSATHTPWEAGPSAGTGSRDWWS